MRRYASRAIRRACGQGAVLSLCTNFSETLYGSAWFWFGSVWGGILGGCKQARLARGVRGSSRCHQTADCRRQRGHSSPGEDAGGTHDGGLLTFFQYRRCRRVGANKTFRSPILLVSVPLSYKRHIQKRPFGSRGAVRESKVQEAGIVEDNIARIEIWTNRASII